MGETPPHPQEGRPFRAAQIVTGLDEAPHTGEGSPNASLTQKHPPAHRTRSGQVSGHPVAPAGKASITPLIRSPSPKTGQSQGMTWPQ